MTGHQLTSSDAMTIAAVVGGNNPSTQWPTPDASSNGFNSNDSMDSMHLQQQQQQQQQSNYRSYSNTTKWGQNVREKYPIIVLNKIKFHIKYN